MVESNKHFLTSHKLPWTIVGFLIVAMASIAYSYLHYRFNCAETMIQENRVFIVNTLKTVERNTTLLEQLMERQKNE